MEVQSKQQRSDWWDSWNPTTKFTRTPEGYLKGIASVTCIGVFEYRNDDGSVRRELRLPEEVFNADSLASLEGKPVTLMHPEDAVTTANVDSVQIGTVIGRIDSNSYEVFAGVVVHKADAIESILNGTSGLSCGYDCDLEWKSGVHMGQRYDAIQRNIRYNHLSVVPQGRAGDTAKIRLDSFGTRVDTQEPPKQKENTMDPKTIRVDEVDYQVPAHVAIAYKRLDDSVKSLTASQTALTAENSTLKAERDALRERADKADEALSEMKKTHVDAATAVVIAKARIDIEQFATANGVKFDSTATDLEIKKATISLLRPKRSLDGADESYINAAYKFLRDDAAEEQEGDLVHRDMAPPPAQGGIAPSRNDQNDPAAARRDMIKNQYSNQ